jgi:hypothetical protein
MTSDICVLKIANKNPSSRWKQFLTRLYLPRRRTLDYRGSSENQRVNTKIKKAVNERYNFHDTVINFFVMCLATLMLNMWLSSAKNLSYHACYYLVVGHFIKLRCFVQVKQPGLEMSTVQSELDLSYRQRYQGLTIPEAYERLILDTYVTFPSSCLRHVFVASKHMFQGAKGYIKRI